MVPLISPNSCVMDPEFRSHKTKYFWKVWHMLTAPDARAPGHGPGQRLIFRCGLVQTGYHVDMFWAAEKLGTLCQHTWNGLSALARTRHCTWLGLGVCYLEMFDRDFVSLLLETLYLEKTRLSAALVTDLPCANSTPIGNSSHLPTHTFPSPYLLDRWCNFNSFGGRIFLPNTLSTLQQPS